MAVLIINPADLKILISSFKKLRSRRQSSMLEKPQKTPARNIGIIKITVSYKNLRTHQTGRKI
ncbi:hypothetical protein, partial [Treponema sp. R6D11]